MSTELKADDPEEVEGSEVDEEVSESVWGRPARMSSSAWSSINPISVKDEDSLWFKESAKSLSEESLYSVKSSQWEMLRGCWKVTPPEEGRVSDLVLRLGSNEG